MKDSEIRHIKTLIKEGRKEADYLLRVMKTLMDKAARTPEEQKEHASALKACEKLNKRLVTLSESLPPDS